jgi:transposase
MKFAAQSERYSAEQRACWTRRWTLTCRRSATRSRSWHPLQPPRLHKQQPKRQPLPAHLPRREIRHEPESTTCAAAAAR